MNFALSEFALCEDLVLLIVVLFGFIVWDHIKLAYVSAGSIMFLNMYSVSLGVGPHVLPIMALNFHSLLGFLLFCPGCVCYQKISELIGQEFPPGRIRTCQKESLSWMAADQAQLSGFVIKP